MTGVVVHGDILLARARLPAACGGAGRQAYQETGRAYQETGRALPSS